MMRGSFLFLFLLVNAFISAQPSNDECFTPIELPTTLGKVCSETGVYSNAQATFSSSVIDPVCWPNDPQTPDVWFSFRASGTAVTITIIGNTVFMPGGTMRNPQFAIYEGVCGGLSEMNCASDATGSNSIELVQTDLVVGQRYYLRVAARAAFQGTFQLCLTSFNLTPAPESDCVDAVLLCDKSSFNVENLVGTGVDVNEIFGLNLCLPNELASSWYKWIAKDAGTLTFSLTPNNPEDDIDFILFEMPNGVSDCSNLRDIRCMASGANINDPPGNWVRCTGPTGLMQGDPDLVELQDCVQASNNNFVKEVNLVPGTAYALLINNFSQSGQGFTMDFGGSGTFVGPEATIIIVDGQDPDFIACDKTFTLDQLIDFPSGAVADIEWRFGVDATPQQVSGPGPHSVTYSSIGFKTITLSLTTNRGCIFNEILELDVLPCCDDIVGYDVVIDSTVNLICPDAATGTIAVSGVGGNPFYEYSLNGMNWQFNDIFTNLDAGDYQVMIRDRKGCIDSVVTSVTSPPDLLVDAGRDLTIGLGCDVDIAATVTPINSNVSYFWSSSDTGFIDPGIFSFNTFPPGTTTYSVTITNEVGCTASNEIIIFSDDVRPIYIPNAFSPNNDGINDYFTVFANKATDKISLIEVYDRWGARVFKRVNIAANVVTMGWDGTDDGQILNNGVYAYVVKVLFVDGVEQVFHGEISIIK